VSSRSAGRGLRPWPGRRAFSGKDAIIALLRFFFNIRDCYFLFRGRIASQSRWIAMLIALMQRKILKSLQKTITHRCARVYSVCKKKILRLTAQGSAEAAI
jgi:hypothetical protein